MNEFLTQWDLLHLKPLVRVLLLPPVPLLLLLAALALLPWRTGRLVRVLVLAASVGLWLLGTPAVGHWLVQVLTRPPAPLSAVQRHALVGAPNTAILVLGAGRDAAVPEYDGAPDLAPLGLARLRYGAWLARQTGLPLGYSGGVGHAAAAGASEAQIAALVVQRDQGLRLRWREGRSRDTRENARFSVAMLQADGIRQIVLVTDASHQRRALAMFRLAIAEQPSPITVLPAPMNLSSPGGRDFFDWVPTPRGLQQSWTAVYEFIGRLAGA